MTDCGKEGVPVEEAIMRTCRERARPVLLTAVTAILGVLPIAFAVNIDFLNREVTQGAPSAQWWIRLSTAIVFGLGFATILTLVVTPASLAFLAKIKRLYDRIFRRNRTASAAGGVSPAHVRGPDLPGLRHGGRRRDDGADAALRYSAASATASPAACWRPLRLAARSR